MARHVRERGGQWSRREVFSVRVVDVAFVFAALVVSTVLGSLIVVVGLQVVRAVF